MKIWSSSTDDIPVDNPCSDSDLHPCNFVPLSLLHDWGIWSSAIQHDNHNDFIIILIFMIVTIILIVSLLVMMVIYNDNSPMSILGYLMISD